MRILFLTLLYISVLENKLIVKDAGISSISRGDIGMIFYIVVENTDSSSYNVIVKMDKCCEFFSNTDMDCQMMQLVGGNMGVIDSKQVRRLSLIYPNMYPHNRYGQCLITVKYCIYSQIKVKIEFNTTLDKHKTNAVMKGYYSRRKLMCCSTIDLDPLERCAPVNCEMKYLGNRNFFNHYWNRCQKVPICIADTEKSLPDVSYVPICNQCKDLENVLTSEDVQYLQSGKIEECWETQVAPLLSANIRCHHGKLNNETGFCTCSNGWMTAPIDKDQYEPGLSIYHMCNLKVYSWKESRNAKLKQTFIMIGIVGAVISLILLVISLLCHLFYNAMFYSLSSSSSSTTPSLEGTTISDDLLFARVIDVTSAPSYFETNYSLFNPPSQDTVYRITELNEGTTQTDYGHKHEHYHQEYEIDDSSLDETSDSDSR